MTLTNWKIRAKHLDGVKSGLFAEKCLNINTKESNGLHGKTP
jgi:hypothetical protein